ncbi:hypothetical protein GCM10007147_35940 [Nocardiopsis kunsanensis]|uniref:Uncharacterized protein n=1 Tax=Nocardiopsis kunsanensis TaxID=141693 RepID=A0A918XHL6_9ACTN|nr:hypothetical protein GCM10007147_35940 [Nocardiopsis kunsanensis]
MGHALSTHIDTSATVKSLNIIGTTTEVFRYGKGLRESSLSDRSSGPVTSPTDLT